MIEPQRTQCTHPDCMTWRSKPCGEGCYWNPQVKVIHIRAASAPLHVPGCGRDADNEQALCFYFTRRVTDEEMRFLHDVIKRAVACMPKDFTP